MLVVDDEEAIADLFARSLEPDYETRVAYGGAAALDAMDESVDAVLLDRRMPDVHGDEVLAAIRRRGHDCPVVMTTAVDPDLNILEMDFDDYLVKPVDAETLAETLDPLIDSRASGDPRLEEFFAVVSKLEILEEELSPAELETSDEYARRKREAEELGRELEESHEDFEDIVATFRDVSRNS